MGKRKPRRLILGAEWFKRGQRLYGLEGEVRRLQLNVNLQVGQKVAIIQV